MTKEANRRPKDQASEANDLKAATALWKTVGTFAFLAGCGIWAAMASESIGPDGTFKWSSLDSYSVALFAVPLLSGSLTVACMIGRAYAKSIGSVRKRSSRIPNLGLN